MWMVFEAQAVSLCTLPFNRDLSEEDKIKGPGSEDSETLTTPLRVPPTCTQGLADKSPNMERPPSAT